MTTHRRKVHSTGSLEDLTHSLPFLSSLSHGSSSRDERRRRCGCRTGGNRDDGEGAGDGHGLHGDGPVGAAGQGQHDEQAGEVTNLVALLFPFLQFDISFQLNRGYKMVHNAVVAANDAREHCSDADVINPPLPQQKTSNRLLASSLANLGQLGI